MEILSHENMLRKGNSEKRFQIVQIMYARDSIRSKSL